MNNLVLVIEDEHYSLTLIKDFLQISGYKTLEAPNGVRGIEMAKKYRPGLILMDIQMPIMDGLEATRILKDEELTKEIPIVAITANAMKGDREKIFEAGCNGYLSKPYNLHDLLQKVKEFCPSKPS